MPTPESKPALQAEPVPQDPVPLSPSPQPVDARTGEVRWDAAVSSPGADRPAVPLQPIAPSRARPVQPRAPLEAPPARPVTRDLPLSDAVIAGRAAPARDQGQGAVIQVTIDRLDVRAPAAPANAVERRRPTPQPSVSLSDYLREGAWGGRR